MQESVSMHKSPTPVRHSRMNQARSEEEEKERTGKTEARRLMERKAAQQNKNLFEQLKLDVDPRRDDDASPMSSYRCMSRPTSLFMDRMIAPINVQSIS